MDEVTPADLGIELDVLRERVAALKHDLGKYVAWMSANLDDDAWRGPASALLTSALQRDLLRTRTRADGAPEAAWEVWERLTRDLGAAVFSTYGELRRVREAVATLREAESAVRVGGSALTPYAPAIRGAQDVIRVELRALQRVLRAR
ncbi:MAG: hypothetical protein H6713_21000 [Myxococcales bacterium]|nr:hypothetical protein [Myxococcales bacterium]MCB9752440.1 hypothetical protein [Myxococcales bacterium]